MFKKLYLFAFSIPAILLFVFLFKNNDVSKINTISNSKILPKLEKIGEKIFPLDSLTIPKTTMLQIIKEDNDFLLYYLNMMDNTIRIFDYETGKEKQIIDFKKREDNIGAIMSFYVHNSDSLFIYTDKNLFLCNNKLEIRNTIEVKGKTKAWMTPSVSMPLTFKDNKVYGLAIQLTDDKYSHTLEIDLATKEVRELPIDVLPQKDLKNGYWGTGYDLVYYNYLPNLGKWAYSFQNDENIYLSDLKNNDFKTVKTETKSFGILTPPYNNKEDMKKATQKNENINFYNSINSYANLITGSDTYYTIRVVFPSQQDQETEIVSLIVLDEKLNKLNEYSIDASKYTVGMSFLTKEGLHIPRTVKNDENNLVFDIFKI